MSDPKYNENPNDDNILDSNYGHESDNHQGNKNQEHVRSGTQPLAPSMNENTGAPNTTPRPCATPAPSNELQHHIQPLYPETQHIARPLYTETQNNTHVGYTGYLYAPSTPSTPSTPSNEIQYNTQSLYAQHTPNTVYDPTGHYANAYNRLTGVGDTASNNRHGNFELNRHQSQNDFHYNSSPEYGGLERIDINGSRTPLPEPVIAGRIVKQPGGHYNAQDNDQAYQDTEWGDGPSLFRQDLIPHEGTYCPSSYSTQGDVDSEPFTPGHNRFRVPGAGINSPQYVQDEAQMRINDSGLYISGSGPDTPHQPEINVHGTPHDSPTRFWPRGYDGCSQVASSRVDDTPGYFKAFGKKLEPSRYSGVVMPWGVQSVPKLVNQDAVSDASLLKRNIARGQGKQVSKRGYGASDPENIAIVNMKEFDDLPFDEIAKKLNDKRVREGKDPSLSAVGVNSRYNRTAPLLYQAQGQEFIPLSKRRGRAREVFEAHKNGVLLWDDHTDLVLVTCVKEVEAAKWTTVAALFQEKTGRPLTAGAAALRHNLL